MTDPDPQARLEPRSRLRVSGRLWLVNVLVCLALYHPYLDAVDPATLRGKLFLWGGRLASAATVSLFAGLPCLLATRLLKGRGLLAGLHAVLWTAVLFAVWVDTRIYAIFRYHFNGLVWNVLTTPGADEAVALSRSDLLRAVVGIALSLVLQVAAFLALWRLAARTVGSTARAHPLVRPRFVWFGVFLPVIFAVAGMYSWADLYRDPQVLAYSRVFPLYPRFTIKRLAVRKFGFKMEDRPDVDMPARGILLDYPKEPATLPRDEPVPNVVMIVIDSLRADMLAPETTPRLLELARESRVFRNHLSGGNATRFGLFSLLYGLHGSYWEAIREEHRSPALIDSLIDRGYEFTVLTSASMDFPEFRSTAWVRVEADVEDRIPGERPGARDDGVTRRFAEWLSTRADPERPFFAFLLLDAPHQRYWFPKESVRFEPYVDDVAYGALADGVSDEDRVALFNRYRNSVFYADESTGLVLDALEAAGEFDSSLILVTGDHGEEFFEHGFWGHTSNFTAVQTHVPFVLHGPGVTPGEELRPTSHIDVPCTILELAGADGSRRAEWSLGTTLLQPSEERVRVISGWSTLGLVHDDVILEVPMSSHGGTGIAVYTSQWQRVFDDRTVLRGEGKNLATLALECRRFLR